LKEKDKKGLITQFRMIILSIGAVIIIAGWGIYWEREVVKRGDLLEVQIVQMEVNKILLLAPYEGDKNKAPLNVKATYDMLELASTRLRGGK